MQATDHAPRGKTTRSLPFSHTGTQGTQPETDRVTDRETDGETDRDTDRDTDRGTERVTYRETDGETGAVSNSKKKRAIARRRGKEEREQYIYRARQIEF